MDQCGMASSKRSVIGVSNKMLIQQLEGAPKHMTSSRTDRPEVPPRVDYAPSPLGRIFDPAMRLG